MAEKFYVTTPIYYANGSPHIGGAYTTIAADVLVRWHKLYGEDVFFLTGTDEHGQKIQEAAKIDGVKPKEFVDKISKEFKNAFKLLNISNNNFIRTTDKIHEAEVKKILQELYDKEFIYKGFYESHYCVGCEQYLSESDLIDGKCPLHNRVPEIRKEESYMFKLSLFQNKLIKLIKSGEYCILPEIRRKEIITFINGGLKDISISRVKEKVSWGIELPFDKNHTCFVWVDAFWNYVSGLIEKKKFDEFWPADLQLMAKDIIRVHATIWPALLLALDYKLPKTLFVHGYFTINGKKMSKSLGNVISPIYLTERYGADSVRYYLMRNISFGQDGDVSEQALVDRHNNELANKLGNLVSRISALAEKYGVETANCEKSKNEVLVRRNIPFTNSNLFTINLKKNLWNIGKLVEESVVGLMQNYEIDKALNEIFAFIDICNEYVQEKKPWETKDKKVLGELVEALREIARLLSPFIPESAEKIAKIFRSNKIKKAPVLFEKLETPKIEAPKANLNKAEEPKEIMEGVTTIQFDDFAKVDLRVAEIKEVEEIPKADKLYKLIIDDGEGGRTICAGIKEFYKMKDLKGKKIIIVANLAPRIMRGIESKGMLLAASNKDHTKVSLISPDQDIEPGSLVG